METHFPERIVGKYEMHEGMYDSQNKEMKDITEERVCWAVGEVQP